MAEPTPTARELEALKLLWKHGRATVRALYQALKPAEEELAYTTVLSLLQTMEQKGLVGHESAGKAHLYFARVPREKTYRQLAGNFLDRVFDGAMNEYMVRALESRPASLEELEELERMIATAKGRLRQPRRKEEPS